MDQMAANGSIGAAYSMRLFTAWQAAGTSYSNLVVNISASCHIGDDGDHVGGRCGAAYSTDGGSTWNHIYSYVSTSTNGDVQTTWTATITGTPLSGVQVGVCALAASDPGGQGTSATITTYDIWTTGTTSSHTTGYVMRPYKQN